MARKGRRFTRHDLALHKATTGVNEPGFNLKTAAEFQQQNGNRRWTQINTDFCVHLWFRLFLGSIGYPQ
jgi:hypothetical protein